MTEEMQAALREWLRDNLVIDVQDAAWSGRDVMVGLRFKGEHDVFSSERISIPTNA